MADGTRKLRTHVYYNELYTQYLLKSWARRYYCMLISVLDADILSWSASLEFSFWLEMSSSKTDFFMLGVEGTIVSCWTWILALWNPQ